MKPAPPVTTDRRATRARRSFTEPRFLSCLGADLNATVPHMRPGVDGRTYRLAPNRPSGQPITVGGRARDREHPRFRPEASRVEGIQGQVEELAGPEARHGRGRLKLHGVDVLAVIGHGADQAGDPANDRHVLLSARRALARR